MMRSASSLALALAFGVTAVAHADTTTFDLTASGAGFSTSEVFIAVPGSAAGTYDITGVSGTVTIGSVTTAIDSAAFIPDPSEAQMLSVSGAELLDQIYYTPAASSFPFDAPSGFSFTDVNGIDYSFYNDGTNNLFSTTFAGENATWDPGYTITSISITPAPTPEPSSLMLLGTSILGVAGAARRRFRKA